MHSAQRLRRRSRYFSRILTGALCSLCLASASSAASPKALELKWNFLISDPLVYSIDQEIKTQLDQLDTATGEWKKTPVSDERIDGHLYLNPTGDGKSRCDLILELKESRNKNRATPLPPEQFLPQLVARFILGNDGGIEDYADRKSTRLNSSHRT